MTSPTFEDPDDPDLQLVFLTLTLREARRVEALLVEWGLSFEVRSEPVGRTIFGLARHGACFYVRQADAAACATRLTAAGFGHGVIGPEDANSGA
jgi:hypothetical protein